nr:ribonuclease H-like domain-containing protein [Tanacetum cinerariifolium]
MYPSHLVLVGNKMHNAFPLPVMEFPLPGEVPTVSEESSHYQKKRDATAHKIALLLKSSSNCQSKSYDSYAKLVPHVMLCSLGITVIEFGDSYEVPANAATTGTASDGTGKKNGRTVTLTADDMQKRKNDVKARTTLLLSLPDELQLRFTKHNRGNEEVNTASVSTASTNVSTASANIGVASISQDTACAYIASQSSGSQIKFKDINQIDEDNIEEMDIKWNMALLSMRADRAPRSQDRGRRDNYRQGFKFEEQASKALMVIDGVGWDWSYMANDEENHALVVDEEAPIEFALMAKTSAESKVFDSSLCSKACKKNTDSLNSKITKLTDKLFDAKNMIYHYKLALAQVEARLAELRNQELKYCEKIRVLEFKTKSSTDCIENLKKELELIKKEKEGLDTKLTGFQTASKDLDSLLESQRLDKNKEGLGYKCADVTVTDYSRPAPTIESFTDDAQNKNPSVTKTEASPSTISPKPFIKFVKANDSPTKSKIDKVEIAKKPPVKYTEQYRKPKKKTNVRGNQRNWNNLKPHQLGPNFMMEKKACFNCGDFNHLAYDCRKRMKNGISRSQNKTHKSFTPRPVVHTPYKHPMRPMRPNMNAAQPNRISFNKPLTHLYNKRPFQRTSAVRSQFRALWVPTVNRNFPTINRKFATANRKFPTGGTKFSTADMGKKGKADSGCSRHMIGNISFLSDYEPFDGGYVSFGQGGCKITGKGTIKTSKLEFENVYFVKDLKYNLFSVSQIYDNKNSVLFTDSECIVLGRDFKLIDDSNVLLRTPRQHNMYSIDLNNIVPHKDLTCLVAKASADECMLWHRRL